MLPDAFRFVDPRDDELEDAASDSVLTGLRLGDADAMAMVSAWRGHPSQKEVMTRGACIHLDREQGKTV